MQYRSKAILLRCRHAHTVVFIERGHPRVPTRLGIKTNVCTPNMGWSAVMISFVAVSIVQFKHQFTQCQTGSVLVLFSYAQLAAKLQPLATLESGFEVLLYLHFLFRLGKGTCR